MYCNSTIIHLEILYNLHDLQIYSIHVSTNLILVEVLFFILKYCQVVELAFHIILINILCLPEDDFVIENSSL